MTVHGNGNIRFEFFDENGKSLYHTVKPRWNSFSVLPGDGAVLLRRIHAQYDARRRDVGEALSSRDSLRKRQAELGPQMWSLNLLV